MGVIEALGTDSLLEPIAIDVFILIVAHLERLETLNSLMKDTF